jgi:hypothetical protein
VRTISLQGSYDLTTRFADEFSSVAMTAVPHTGSNGHPQIISFGEKTDGRVKAESRDAGSGQFDYRVALPLELPSAGRELHRRNGRIRRQPGGPARPARAGCLD